MPRTMFERLIDFSLRHARLVVAATLAMTLVFGWFAAKVQVNPDFISLLPRDAEVNALLAEYGAKATPPDVLVFAVTADDGDVFAPTRIAAYSEAVAAIAALPGVQSAISPFNLVRFDRESGRLAIRLMSPGGVAPDAGRVEEFRARLAGTTYARNLVVSADGKMLISYFQTESMGSFRQLMARVDGIAAAVRSAGLTPYVTGTIPLNVRTEYHLSRDATRLLLMAALIILLSYLASYRSLRAVVLPFLSVLLGTVWTVGFMGMAGFSLSLITIVAPPLILIFGNEYAVYATSEYLRIARAEAAAPGWIARATRSVASPIAMAVLTTVIGFLSLLGTSIRQTREFAVTAGFGSLACAFLALLFLPAMCSLLRPPVVRSHAPGGGMERALRAVAMFSHRHPAVAVGTLGVVAALFAVTIRLLAFNTDPASYFPASDPVLRDMRVIYDHTGGYEQMAVSFDAPGAKPGYFLDADVLARVQAVERELQSIPDVSYTLSLPDLLCEANRAATGETAIPSNRATIIALSRLVAAAAGSSPGGELLASLVDREFTRVTIVVRIFNADTRHYMDEARARALLSDMRNVLADNPIGASAVVWGDLLRNLSFADTLRRTLGISMAVSLLSILVLTIVVFRSFGFGIYPLVPLAAGLLLNYSMMALVGIPLDMTTIMVSNIAIGAGVDNAIYLVIQYRRELARSPTDPARALGDTLAVMGQPVLLSSFSIIIGMLVFATAAFRPVVYFGMLVLFTLLATTAGTLVTLPAILALDTRVRAARARRRGRGSPA